MNSEARTLPLVRLAALELPSPLFMMPPLVINTWKPEMLLSPPPPRAPVCTGILSEVSMPLGSAGQTAGLPQGLTTGDPAIDAMVVSAATRNGLDPALIYSVMLQESAFKRQAVSQKGASGLMQLMPPTAVRFGVRNIFDPQQNIEAGARYLRFLLNTFGGDVSLALAAYNSGEGTVKKYGHSIPPYRETIRYVSQIRQRYQSICAPPSLVAEVKTGS